MQRTLSCRAVCAAAVWGIVAGAFGLTGLARAQGAEPAAHPAPVVAGYERLKEAKSDDVTRGEVLLGELNCLACHSAEGQKHVLTKGAPDLSNVGARATPQFLKAYLTDPHGEKPGSTMPDIFRASEPASKQGAVEFLTQYLVSLGGPIAPATQEGNTIQVDQGRTLYHTIGCVACHAPENGFAAPAPQGGGAESTPKPAASAGPSLPSVPLGNLAAKTTVDRLVAFLLDPLKARPGSRMPSSNLTPGEARAIAVYLLREQLDNPAAAKAGPLRSAGLHYAYYESGRMLTAEIERLERLHPKSEGSIDNFDPSVPNHRNENFAVKFTGAIHIAKSGKYTFWTKSDDGSRLYVDSKPVVDNDGVHAPEEKSGSVELQEGDHPIAVTFFQAGSGYELAVEWEGPDIKRGPVPNDVLFHVGGRPMIPLGNEPFTVDAQKAQTGKQMFAAIGCASCHAIAGEQSTRTAKPLAQINPEAGDGCLAEHVAKGLPDYELSADQRQDLLAAIKADKNPAVISTPLQPKNQVIHAMAALNCYACHVRDNIGGPGAGKSEFFGMTGNFDLGDEGRLPPKLTGVGDKLYPTAIEQIVFEGNLHVRPWMATRMPRFSRDVLAFLSESLAQADGPEVNKLPPFSAASAADGRKLVGTKGLGCVNCHGVGGNKSLGIPSIDLSSVHDRLRPGWFHDYLVNPPAKNPGTRMPAFWLDGKVSLPTIAGGTMDGQIDAIWNYTSLGKSMPLPTGIQPLAGAGMELTPTDEPIVHRTFMADVGSRSILVGFPERVHVAFDANNIRLAKAWHGRFFDASGQWEGRGGKLNPPLGTDVINMPPGASFAILASPDAPWPVLKVNDRNPAAHFKGYVLDDKDRPIFHYVLDILGGDIEVQEQEFPVLSPGKATLVRDFHLKSALSPKDLYFQAAWGKKIESASPGVWTIDDSLTLSLPPGATAGKPVIRDFQGGKQLLFPVEFAGGAAAISVQMSW
jgi:cytochrome c553